MRDLVGVRVGSRGFAVRGFGGKVVGGGGLRILEGS